MAVFVRLN